MDRTSRRLFLRYAAATIGLAPFCWENLLFSQETKPSQKPLSAANRIPFEWAFTSGKKYQDPYNEVSLDVEILDPQGGKQLVPAYWAGGQTWKVRYASHTAGRYNFRTICTDSSNSDLHDQTGSITISDYKGSNPLYQHGPLRVSSDQRHFAHENGTPFFWLGDTWWFGLCKRFGWPEDFKSLTADRVKKGFTVVQITSGLNPEDTGGGTSPFDPRSMNEAGYPWEDNYARINPKYWDLADVRMQYLVDNGLVPCIVGAWGYHLPPMGVEKMQKHWRYIIARWGALPVVWCLAGELTMPFWPPRTASELGDLRKEGLTIAERRKRDSAFQKSGWTDVARYIRANDPYHRMLTLHPEAMHSCLNEIDDPSLLDFELLQTSHDDWWGTPASLGLLVDELQKTRRMPVMIGEVAYEGLWHNREDVVRFDFWSAILSGAAGHTYGAGGIFEMESSKEPYGRTPDGDWHSYGDEPWDVAAHFPGSQQLAWGKELLLQFEWWRLEPHPEWVEPHWTPEKYRLPEAVEWHWPPEKYLLPYAAFIPGELAIVYLPTLLSNKPDSLHAFVSPTVSHLDPKVKYEAFWFCAPTGKEELIPEVNVQSDGTWIAPVPNEMVDWVLVIAKAGSRKKGKAIRTAESLSGRFRNC
jgi:hypothetical protein